MNSKAGDWYDKYYHEAQPEMPPWYRCLIPDLTRELKPQSKLLELGCGLGHVLRHIVDQGLIPEERIYAVDQSKTAVTFLRERLPRSQLAVGDIHQLPYSAESFDVVLLMETIEHLEQPMQALESIHQVTASGGMLYISFPNYLHFPWLLVRILAEKLNKPNWIGLQPVDKIYTVFGVISMVKRAGFAFERGIGCNYGPPVLYPWETDRVTHFLNALGLWWVSFHPILKFRKRA